VAGLFHDAAPSRRERAFFADPSVFFYGCDLVIGFGLLDVA
jgi:hypothetical protein